MKASIIIPLKNGGDIFRKVICSVLEQEIAGNFEIIVIDSGSKDGSLEYIENIKKEHENIIIKKIMSSEFGHGKTRNLGASLACGEILVFITQDALPANKFWLSEMIAPFSIDENIKGVFGKHIPYDDCDIFEKHNLEIHFNNFGKGIVVYKIDDWERYQKDDGYKHLLCFYSDNSSAMRKDIWEIVPYDDVDFAEDQLWAKKIIEMGYSKAYNENAVVYHSHNYNFTEMLKRSYDDHKGLNKIYSYNPVSNILWLIPYIIKHILSDISYLRSQPILKSEKWKWLFYSIKKNIAKYIGAYFGPKGVNNRIIDRIFSREFTLRRK